MFNKDKDILDIGVLLNEDSGLNSPEALEHLRALYGMFSSPARARYEIRARVWKNRYAAANEKPEEEEE